jgi:hypothetical protein
MLQDHICILYCKQCMMVDGYRICWFSRFGFPGENICIMCVFSIVSFLLFY